MSAGKLKISLERLIAWVERLQGDRKQECAAAFKKSKAMFPDDIVEQCVEYQRILGI
jgi:hypothetical protein